MRSSENSGKYVSGLFADNVGCTAVVDYIMGGKTLLVQRHLKIFSPGELFRRPAPACMNAPLSVCQRGINEYDRIAVAVQTNLKKKRNIPDIRPHTMIFRRQSHYLRSLGVHNGVNISLQPLLLGRV